MIEIEAHLARVEVVTEAGPHACYITNQSSACYTHDFRSHILMAVCKSLSNTTNISVTAVTQFTQVSLAINVGRTTLGIDSSVS